tara:strand:- start:530 stop:1678 length:1149 start_codon:yes stop_codon:yes gene_type:complete
MKLSVDDFTITFVTYNNSYFIDTLFRSIEMTEGIIKNPIIILDISKIEQDIISIENIVNKWKDVGMNIDLVNRKKLIVKNDIFYYEDQTDSDFLDIPSSVELNIEYVLSLSETEYSFYIHSDITFLKENWRNYIVSKVNDGLDAFGFSPFYDGLSSVESNSNGIFTCQTRSETNRLSNYNNYLPLNPVFIFAKTVDLLKVGFNHVWPRDKLEQTSINIKNPLDDDEMERRFSPSNYSFNFYDFDLVLRYMRTWPHPRIGWNWFHNFHVEHGAFTNYIYDIGGNVYTLYYKDPAIDILQVFEKKNHKLNLPDQIGGSQISHLMGEIIKLGDGEEFIYHGPWRFNTRENGSWREKVGEDILKILEEIELEYLEEKGLKNDIIFS